MKKLLAIMVVVLVTGTVANADLLWDNYLGGNPSDPTAPHDSITAFSSERDTLVTDCWAADDVIFPEEGVDLRYIVEEIRWIGMRDANYTYQAADIIILDGQFNVMAEYWDLAYTATVIGSDFGLETYEGSVDVSVGGGSRSVELEPGHYYVAARLVDADLGRNYVATTGAGAINGLTYGAFQSNFFGFPDWTLNSDEPTATTSEYAYQVYGYVVPEPTSLLLLVAGGLAGLRRR